MINPQMMGASPIPDVPSVNELWKDEKSKYRHWIILLGVSLIAIFALLLTSLILNLVDKENIINKAIAQLIIDNKDNEKYTYSDAKIAAERYFNQSLLIFPIIQNLLLLIGIIAYAYTIYQSYKEHNFAKISMWPTYIIGFSAFFAGFNLLSVFLTGASIQFLSSGITFAFVTNILFVVVYFVVSVPVSRVRRLFALSTQVERMKNDPQFQAAQAQWQNMMNAGGFANNSANSNPYGPSGATNNQTKSNPQNNDASQPKTVTPAQPTVSPTKRKLQEMSMSELKEIAKKFLISGYQTMQKDELIEAILRVSGRN